MKTYHVMGNCHTDLAWVGDEAQYAAYLEQFTVILLDMLEQFPDMTYVVEQAYHYRSLERRRPDLVARLTRFIEQGRVEVVGGMISTSDFNMPAAESLVRNLLMGLRWFARNMHAKVSTGWLFDSFGCSAQMPQLLASFGMRQMIASRFGGEMCHDVFYARGLDGTEMLAAGRDCFSPNLPDSESSRVYMDYAHSGAAEDAMFDRARQNKLDGAVMVNAYIEDGVYPTRRLIKNAHALIEFAKAQGDKAAFSLPRDFFADLTAQGTGLPVEFADLNPEFTGTFAQRIRIRLCNRRAETALLDVEKWLALRNRTWEQRLRDCWWELGFVHFHDVFTGSHPQDVFRDVITRLDRVQQLAVQAMEGIFGAAGTESRTLRVVNGLPFARRDWVSVPYMAQTACLVRGAHGVVSSYVQEGRLWFEAHVQACATAVYTVEDAAQTPAKAFFGAAGRAELENEHLRLTVDAVQGVTLVRKQSGAVLLDGAKDLLVLQGDTGSFQIERIASAERYAWASPVRVAGIRGDEAVASGAFLDEKGRAEAVWTLTFTLRAGERQLGIHIRADWQAIGKRLRLKLNTALAGAGDGVYEIPFGVVRRRAYTPAFNRKGEWPTQRFAAVEDGTEGIALINDGVPGVETLGGALYTTILRAPTEIYAGMVPDDSSQQHGVHEFAFAVLPYAGDWTKSDVLRAAQRWNQPLRVFACEDATEQPSALAIDRDAIVLSTVKQPEDASRSGIFIRMGESHGQEAHARIRLAGVARAYDATMSEEIGEPLPVEGDEILLDFKPWQVRTVYTERK